MKAITLVLTTARKERESEKVFRYLESLFKERDKVSLTTVDVRDHVSEARTIPPWGTDGVKTNETAWQTIAQNTDAFVFVIPEYNHGYPGEFKLLLDSLYDEYKGKDAYIVGVSEGAFSGVRVADHIKPVLVELQLVLHRTALYIGNVDTVFKTDGVLTDETVALRTEKFVDAVSKKA